MIIRRAMFWGLLLALIPPTPGTCQASSEVVFPGEEWEYVGRSQLESYGWSPEGLRASSNFVRDSANSTGIVVVDRGRVVFTYGDIEELSYIASCRKSILAML